MVITERARERGNMIKAIIFDFDGVITESNNIKANGYLELFAEFPEAIPEFKEYHRNHFGAFRNEKIRYFYAEILGQELTPEKSGELVHKYADAVFGQMVTAPYVKGIIDFLEQNKEQYRFFIVTGCPTEEVKEVARQRGIAHYFRAIYGSPKDKAENIRGLLLEHKLKNKEVIFIGDTESDWEYAARTRVPFVARLTPESGCLAQSYPYIIKDMTELTSAIERLST